MSENVIPLRPAPAAPVPEKPRQTLLRAGRYYRFQSDAEGASHLPSGLVGGYRFDAQSARIEPAMHNGGAALAYPYDADSSTVTRHWRVSGEDGPGYSLEANRLSLESTELQGPELVGEGALTYLRMRPVFHLGYYSDAYAAQLGVIHLVQSQRFMMMSGGERIELLEAETPVLYLQSEEAIALLSDGQPQGQRQNYEYSLGIQQAILAQQNGVTVESVTVLEQYHSYFMQRECTDDAGAVIWTPALAPITWGWSIRVGRRSDQEWGILRRKLILPTVGHDGLEFPVWEANQRSLSRPLADER
jgi:hypothetical protein